MRIHNESPSSKLNDEYSECDPPNDDSFTHKLSNKTALLKKTLSGLASTTLSFRGIPYYRKDNEYIERSYRPELQCFYSCFRTMFYLHNETVNIWSHLIAAVVFFKLAVWLAFYPTPMFTWWDKLMLLFYCWGVIIGLSLSWIFHTLECHSETINVAFNKLDYLGICLIIISGFVPYIYFAFYCDVYFKVIYSMGLLICGISVAALVIQNKLEDPEFRNFRTTLFSLLVVFGLLPYFHYFVEQGFWRMFHFSTGGWMIITLSFLLGGAVFYVSTFPECFYPGMFDLYFQSHQIMHVLVALALFVHCIGIGDFAQQVKICRLCAIGCK